MKHLRYRVSRINGLENTKITLQEAADLILADASIVANDEDTLTDLQTLATRLRQMADNTQDHISKLWEEIEA